MIRALPALKFRHLLGFSFCISSLLTHSSLSTAQELRVPPSQRWLEVQQLSGTVTYRGPQTRPAQIGDRLDAVGQGIDTSGRSASVLEIDTLIGVVRLAENTSVRVNQLSVLPSGARTTILSVPRGQARLQLRQFTNPDSELEIRTPAGVAAVRGTEFGVRVEESGKTAVGTLSGSVDASAQGVTVAVGPGFASVIIPGEPPTPPFPLDRVLRLNLGTLRRTSGTVIVAGTINPANTLTLGDREIRVQEDGSFRTTIRSPLGRSLNAVVQNPLGEARTYSVVVR